MRHLRRFGFELERASRSEIRALRRYREAGDERFDLFDVLPKSTEPQLTGWLDPHIIAAPRQSATSPHLWIFLGGSYGRPQRQVSIIEHIASLGHWAINLRYPNDWTIGGLSRRGAGIHAHEALRLQILDGRARSGLLDLPPQDCILNRVQKVLIWLARQHPEQGWSAFLSGDEARWDRVAVAGHSQGGGHAAIMGKQLPLERVVMLSAPADCVASGEEPAPWLRPPGATPCDNYFGFSHLRDPAIGRILSAWEALGLAAFGPVTEVDTSSPPFGNSHRLVTNHEVPGDRHHGSVAADRFIPRLSDRTPVFHEVWTFLFSLR